ncbi:hypothetical protein JG687_00007035 [Phytophthora cactorum]|uniref:Uncharacterized protein n=1 Tax=Phytophthora cactorum TaxID=29920 RepID=A0A8T1UG95_9STRA|nr:hypothetical protein PC120_g10470 [Phytophthora cactorum]KAG3063456.1 hypothetical protein PC121_g12150 [Phytophthora cactorum]KAG3181586.1 hypothetical protein PC128_g15078 [Phytophthora cactorum]KAG4052744.1 hypothetical protein PC123_g12092 [Phytophthora cactorum]KAG6962628.1 hypothetical protein JG687_00007035 [Phytophthora cactorum]
MPNSEDSSALRHTWTLDEFADLVTAWELATSRPRDANAQTLHDAVYKHFVALRGGSTRRNKAALTSKRSALKFSYLYIREFDNEQKLTNLPTFFELPISKRTEILSSWKKINSSLVEITHVMFQGLGRIVSKGGDDEPVLPIRKRQKELQEGTNTTRMETRPTRASADRTKKKQPATARSTSNPWSSEEMKQLVKAWGIAAQTVCDSKSGEPMSIAHEMFRQFEILQGGSTVRNLSSLATRRRVLKQSYSRISAFDKIQEINGDPKFTDLPATTRQSLIRSWKNANLLDLSTEMYAELHTVIALDTRAVALEDMRRAKATGATDTGRAGRKPGRPTKKQKSMRSMQETKDDDEVDSTFSSQPPSVVDDSEEEKAAIPLMVIQSRLDTHRKEKEAPEPVTRNVYVAKETPVSDDRDTVMAQSVPRQETAAVRTIAAAPDPFQADMVLPISSSTQDRVTQKTLAPKPANPPHLAPVEPVESRSLQIEPQEATLDDYDAPSKSPGRWGKRKRKVHPDGPNGHLWENKELQILIDAWEKAAILVCNSDPAERLSLNREMYREFVEMQGGSSVRNSTALAARRSSLKFSYAHIRSFNDAQEAKGEPSFHDIPENTRVSLLRSWKNRNSVDLTKEMYDGLGRILAMDDKLAEVRNLRPPPVPKAKKTVKSLKETTVSKASDANHASKTAKWTTEESSDLIKACADVMNVPSDKELSQTDRESLIFDAFVARRENAGDTDTPIRRDLRSMAQQWRYILASYSYIKACNDSRSEAESPSWFEMSPMQRRAYQQCTNVPLKFVDLDEEMFALVTKTSFMGVPTSTEPSPAVKTPAEGISLRPRSTRKRTEAFWSSDSESSVSEIPTPDDQGSSKKDPTFTTGKKVSNWPQVEIWDLIQAWEEASESTNSTKLTAALHEAYQLFLKREGSAYRNRTLNSVRNKMIALNSSYGNISEFMAEHGDSSAWFNMTAEQRLAEIRSWGNKTIINLNEEMFNSMTRILRRRISGADEKMGGKRKIKHTKEQEIKGHAGQKPDKYVAANWSKEELLMLGEACGELLEGRRSRRYVFEEEKDRFFRKYEELGGTNSLVAAVGLARFVLDSYEFIYFYSQKATETDCLSWFELDLEDRDAITTRVSKSYRSFNGLTTVDEEIYDVIDKMDAELRVKLGETKKKTYKPPNDTTSSRYVDIEAVVERCAFKKKTNSKFVAREAEAQEQEEEEEADSSLESSEDESSGSDSSAPIVASSRPVAQPEEDATTRVRRDSDASRTTTRPSRKRSRDADVAVEGSPTLYLTEIIQKQNRKLEEAVKRFRKESAVARKEHHEFLLRKIQDSFPIDTGHGSFLERVAEQQGQTLVDIFQRLQQQRDAEKAKDEELMRQLFA